MKCTVRSVGTCSMAGSSPLLVIVIWTALIQILLPNLACSRRAAGVLSFPPKPIYMGRGYNVFSVSLLFSSLSSSASLPTLFIHLWISSSFSLRSLLTSSSATLSCKFNATPSS